MFEIIFSYVSALCQHMLVVCLAAMDHGCLRVIILCYRASGELQIWLPHFLDSRPKHELNTSDKKQEKEEEEKG